MRVYEALGAALGALGSDTAFGLVGGGNYALATAMVEQGGIAFHGLRHESAAVSAADGWARATRRLGLATSTQGPGLTNTLTALSEAVKSRTPLLVLAGDTATTAQYQNQDVDQARIAASVGAGTARLRSPALAVTDLAHAAWRAQRERRPVSLSLPLDVQMAECEDPRLPIPVPAPVPARPADAAVTDAVERMTAAHRPVVLAGRGVWYADAEDAVGALADRIGALLATTAVGNGLFAGHPHCLGISGGFASPLAAQLLGEADLVVAFGASLNSWTTKSGVLFSGAEVVQCDVDATAIGRLHPTRLALVGDARETALALVAELDRRGGHTDGYRTAEVSDAVGRYRRAEDYVDQGGRGTIDPRTAMVALDRALPSSRVVAIDSGHFMGWPAQHLSVTDPGGFVFTQAYQSIGLGLGSAIGACVARPDRPTVLVTGDGGLLMSLGDLETVARNRLPMAVVVLNDAAYSAEVHHFGPMGLPTKLAEFDDCDFADLARALGFDAVTVRGEEDLEGVAAWARAPDGPLLLDCKVARDIRAAWLDEAFRLGA